MEKRPPKKIKRYTLQAIKKNIAEIKKQQAFGDIVEIDIEPLLPDRETFEFKLPVIEILDYLINTLQTLDVEGLNKVVSKVDIDEVSKRPGVTADQVNTLKEFIADAKEALRLSRELQKERKKHVYPAGPLYIEDTLTFARKEPLKPKHYKETTIEQGKQLQKWETPEGTYIQELIDTLPGLNAPVVTGDFVRHMGSIFIMLWKHNRRREKVGEKDGRPVTEMEFDLQQYQRQRGRTDEEIRAGGSFTQRATQLILTGATTAFVKREQDNPGGFEIGHFYRLRGTPGKRRGTFLLSLQEPYREDFLRAYEAGERGGYLPLFEAVITDRSTEGKNDYLMFFVFAVLRQLNTTGKAKPGDFIPMRTLLEKARIGKQNLDRDKEAWRCFIEGIQYYNKMTDGLSSIIFMGEGEQEIIISDFTKLDTLTYDTFEQDYLRPLGLQQSRDLKVAFMGRLPAIKAPETDTGEKLLPGQVL